MNAIGLMVYLKWTFQCLDDISGRFLPEWKSGLSYHGRVQGPEWARVNIHYWRICYTS